MASVNLSPIGNGFQFFTTAGLPLNGGLINTYAAGTVSAQPTFTTSLGNVANANPIVLGTDGRPQSLGAVVEIWLTAGTSYKFQLTDSLLNLIATYDNLTGINDIVSAGGTSEWTVISGLAIVFLGTTSFSLSGNQTAIFTPNLRIKTTNTGGTVYSTVVSSTYNAGPNTTTITVVNDASVLDSGLSAVAYSILNSLHPSLPPYSDAQFIVQDAADATKLLRVNISTLTTATTQTVSVVGAATLGGSVTSAGYTMSGQRLLGNTSTTASAPQEITVSGSALFNSQVMTAGWVNLGTPVSTSAGTSITFANIPTGVRRVTLNMIGSGTTGTSPWLVQIGPTSAAEITGYNSVAMQPNNYAKSVSGFLLQFSVVAGTDTYNGQYTMVLENSTNNTWTFNGAITDVAQTTAYSTVGTKSITGLLAQVKITTVGGTNSFNNGEMNITFE